MDELREIRTTSLNPETFVDDVEEPNESGSDQVTQPGSEDNARVSLKPALDPEILPPSLEEGLRPEWAPEDELKSDTIPKCLLCIKRSIIEISYKQNVSNSEVTRYCLNRGIILLSQFPGVSEIMEIRSIFFQKSNVEDDLRWFETAEFDLGTDKAVNLSSRLFKNDIALANKLAQALGLGAPLVRQLAIMAGLLLSDRIVPCRYNNQMFETVERFKEWVIDRLKIARRKQKRVEKEAVGPNNAIKVGPRKSWKDLLDIE